jgi:ABC-type glycerol-3-phosphate transport system permease component
MSQETLTARAPGKAKVRSRASYIRGRIAGRTGLYLVTVFLAFVFLLPLIWLVSSSLKPEQDVFQYPPNFLPTQIELGNYPYAMGQFPFVTALINTLAVTLGVMVGRLLTASMAAYAFARLRFPFRNALFLIVLSTMMIPYQVLLLPQYIIFRDLHWVDSLKPLIIPSFFGGGAFFIFLLRQFFMTIPKDYDDAARIDGAGMFDIYWRIILRMSLPVLGVVAIFTFMDCWNDFMGPLIYLQSTEKQTLAVAFRAWEISPQHLGFRHSWNHIMAMAPFSPYPRSLCSSWLSATSSRASWYRDSRAEAGLTRSSQGGNETWSARSTRAIQSPTSNRMGLRSTDSATFSSTASVLTFSSTSSCRRAIAGRRRKSSLRSPGS